MLGFFGLTYLDRAISFALPLGILFVLRNEQLYSFVEVVFSYATIAMVLTDMGFSSYLFYGYRNADEKTQFLNGAASNFHFLMLLYVILVVFTGAILAIYNSALVIFFAAIAVRSLFTFFTTFYANIYRLKDKPARIYLYSLAVNIASFVLVFLGASVGPEAALVYFFAPAAVLVLFAGLRFVVIDLRIFDFREFYAFITRTLSYAWPIILNVLTMAYVNNFAKIYAFNQLSSGAMVQVSYVLRIGLVIQLTHAAFSAYFAKTLFMDTNKAFNAKVFKRYSAALGLAVLTAITIIALTNYFFSSFLVIPLQASTILFLLYILIWCYVGYLELYFNLMNANRRILLYSVLSSVIYTGLLLVSGPLSLFLLSLYMVIAALINLTLVLLGLRQLKVINVSVKAR